MAMIFYTYEVPSNSPLCRDYRCSKCFIAYNPVDGETAFFDVFGDCYSEGNIEPFNEEQMSYVKQRWQEYVKDQGHGSPEGFDRQGHEDFMRQL
jgi:hypothetical protein